MAQDYGKWKVDQLRYHLKERMLSVSRYRKDDLVKLCNFVDKFQLLPEPTVEEEAARRQSRLKDILSVSSTCTLPDPGSSSVQWSAAFSDFPEVNLLQIYSYFIKSPSAAYPLEKLKAYKSMSSYRNAIDGFVDQIFISKDLPEKWVFVKGVVCASQTASAKYNAWSLMNQNGDIRACRCMCPAGHDEVCSHVASLLFYVLIINENGLNRKLTPTEEACAWLAPKKKDPSRVPVAACAEDKIAKPDFTGRVTVPETMEERVELIESIAPESALAMARKFQPPPAPFLPDDSLSQAPRPSLPPTPADLAASFLNSSREMAVSSERFAAIVQNCVTSETSTALEEVTREQSVVAEWSSHRPMGKNHSFKGAFRSHFYGASWWLLASSHACQRSESDLSLIERGLLAEKESAQIRH